MTVPYDLPRHCSYAGMPISEVFEADIGLGGVLSLLWFRRRLPDYATKFIEMILMVRFYHAVVTAAVFEIVGGRESSGVF